MICARKTYFKYEFRGLAFEQVGCQDYYLIKIRYSEDSNFENGQIILEPNGLILEASDEFYTRGTIHVENRGNFGRSWFLWKKNGSTILKLKKRKTLNTSYLGIGDKSSIGIHITHKKYPKLKISILSITTGLAPMIH